MMRLDKYVSTAAAISRTQAQTAIRQGRVEIDGAPQKKPETKVSGSENITLDGVGIKYEEYVYLMMDKPEGYLSATEDSRDRTVMELLPEELLRRPLGIVGRLDRDTTGLLILTDNGVVNHRLTSPKYELEKVYEATLNRDATDEDVKAFAAGIAFEDFVAKPAILEIDKNNPNKCRVTITEGKYHQVKRMFLKCGKEVVTLRRISIAGVTIDESLGHGGVRHLHDDERDHLLKKSGFKQ